MPQLGQDQLAAKAPEAISLAGGPEAGLHSNLEEADLVLAKV